MTSLALQLALALLALSPTLSTTSATQRKQGHTKDDTNSNIENESLVEKYQDVKETLREIFAEGVDPSQAVNEDIQEPKYRQSVSSRLTPWGPHDAKLDRSHSDNSILETRRREVSVLEDAEIDRDLALEQGTLKHTHTRLEGPEHAHTHQKGQGHAHHAHAGEEHTDTYLNEWVVHLSGGRELAAAVAKDLGYQFLGQVGDFRDVYRMVKLDHPAAHKRDAPTLTHHLNAHASVVWAEQQYVKQRAKRATVAELGDTYDPYAPLVRVKRLQEGEQAERTHKTMIHRSKRSALTAQALAMEAMFNDEMWQRQWYLYDTRTRPDLPKLDLQVVKVWQAGVTGRGVRLLVLDDGLEWRHTDLVNNYDAETSYDFNDNDDDPTPRYDTHFSNSHGTRCAGEIAMTADNHKCGVGVAYGARVGGIRMLDGPVSDVVEGLALSHALDKVDVVSCSWGPTDDGQRVEGPGRLAEMSLRKGVTEGRGGRGTVYMWAAGNGGSAGDNCNCDGYTSSIFTLSVSSASETGRFPWYGEQCASTLAAAYSSGAYTDQKIATTDLHDTCTDKFTGTSAAAPLAAGIIALALEVNPGLTWRDVQHAVVWSSEWAPLAHNGGWITNARGLRVNPRFGFGLLSAEGLVETVRNWTNVAQQRICKVAPTNRSGDAMKSGGWVVVEFASDGCKGGEHEVRSLEHVQLVATINYTRRGALTITLTSPEGTRSTLLTERVSDRSDKGFTRWAFMTVHTWGEDPSGVWTLNISDTSGVEENGTLGDLELVLHGTREIPQHMAEQHTYRRTYHNLAANEAKEEDEEVYLSALQLRTMTWDQLLQLLTKSTRSTLSKRDIEMLLKEGRLESAVHRIQSQKETLDSKRNASFDWRLVLNELMARR